jgi:glycosyltransferase involved in cell wall biosynthesis
MSYKFSIVVPVFKNEGSIDRLLNRVSSLATSLVGDVEAIFVVDGSPDSSLSLLQNSLPKATFDSKIILLSRNFGAFSAIRVGLREASGIATVVMAADLQEPISLIENLLELVMGHEVDVAVGVRQVRKDSFVSRFLSSSFWRFFNKLTTLEMPKGGVDIFALSKDARQKINEFEESSTSLVGLIYWIGFKRQEVMYRREKRTDGVSSWSLRQRINYAKDSITAFSEIPLSVFLWSGVFGALVSLLLVVVLVVRLFMNQNDDVSRQLVSIGLLFVVSYLMAGLGLLGTYLWRVSDNVRKRPDSIIWKKWEFPSVKGRET